MGLGHMYQKLLFEADMTIIEQCPSQGYGKYSASKNDSTKTLHDILSPVAKFGKDGVSRDEWSQRMRAWLRVLIDPEHWVELRALDVLCEGGSHTKAGLFTGDAVRELIQQALDVGQQANGVYFTLNPVVTNCGRPCDNSIRSVIGGQSIGDAQIAKRRWLLVDLDPKRPSKCSSTDSEKQLAFSIAQAIKSALADKGWPEPVLADSGNGYHLLYRIDLPADDQGLVKKVLLWLDQLFSNEKVEVDTKVDNPSRIVKFYGTQSRKGNHTKERPYRFSEVLTIPAEIATVAREKIEELAAQAPQQLALSTTRPTTSYRIGREEKIERAKAYLRTIPPAIEGQHGSDKAFRVACVLIGGFDLDVEDALVAIDEWNQTCSPPWSEKELRHKLEDADKKAENRGYLLESTKKSNGLAMVVLDPEGRSKDPYVLADALLKSNFSASGDSTLRYWRSEWWQWQGGAYSRLTENEIHAIMWRDLEDLAPTVSNALVSNVQGALKARVLLPNVQECPVWIDGPNCSRKDYLAFSNGLLDLNSYFSGGPVILMPASPKWFSSVIFPYEYNHSADCPRWKAFLQKNLEGDPERIALLQEWFGYCLTPDTDKQRFLLMVGEGANGKSVVSAVLPEQMSMRWACCCTSY